MADANIQVLNDTFINKCNSKAYDKLKHTEAWQDKPWKQFQKIVFRLQKRIYQASKQGNKSLVHKLQKLLLTSRAAKYLAVRRVSQDNQGKRTPGIDGVALLSAKQKVALAESLILDAKANPIRRILIPKPGKKEYRKLGIPITCSYCTSYNRLREKEGWKAGCPCSTSIPLTSFRSVAFPTLAFGLSKFFNKI